MSAHGADPGGGGAPAGRPRDAAGSTGGATGGAAGTPGIRLVLLLAVLSSLLPAPARGQIRLLGGEGASLELSGYARSVTGVHDLGYALPGVEERSAFNTEVVRIEWTGRIGRRLVVEVHDRVLARVSSVADAGRSVAGIGVSAVPGRSVDLEASLVEEERFSVIHDIDRLALTLYTGAADVTVGRQAVTWGISSLFPVADLWSRFSPYELDAEEKPGIDAVRALGYPARGLEVDAVVADRGDADLLSVGVGGTLSLPSADIHLGAGKFWRELIGIGGVAVVLDEAKLRAEAAVPYDLDGGGFDRLRATVGVDWIHPHLVLTGEYHYNGVGADDPAGYAGQLSDPRFLRGESYFLGRHYLGALASWTPDPEERLSLAATLLGNLGDPSLSATTVATYDLGRSTRASVGAFLNLGDAPVAGAPVRFRSEFGSYGHLWFTRVSIYL